MMHANGWREQTFGSCVRLISGGTPSKSNSTYWGGSIPWVSCKDMKTPRIHDAEDHLTELGAANGTKMVSRGTILIVVRGMILAKEFPVARAMRSVCFNQDLKALQCLSNVEEEFFFYWLLANAHEVRGVADEAAHGTKRLQTDRLQSLRVVVPPQSIQKKISATLSTYDDLIENNTRRIQILERNAQAIYREWFVHFRYPRHGQNKLVASALGKIPQGWSVRRLDEVAEVNASAVRRGHELENILYVDIASVGTGRIDKIEPMAFAAAPGRARRIVQHGDTIWSCVRPNRKSFSLILSPPAELIVSTGFAVLTPTKVPFSFLHQAVTTDEFVGYLTNHATGAAYPAVTAKDFEAAKLVVPDEPLLRQFHEHCEPMMLLKDNLLRKNANLRRTRDLLLPKLVSGALDVSKLDIEDGGVTA